MARGDDDDHPVGNDHLYSTKYTPSDWTNSNWTHFNNADQARNNSETIRNEGLRLIAEREDTTVKKQRDSDKRVGERLTDVSHWRSELQTELERNIQESRDLTESRRDLKTALGETEGPLRVTKECLYKRKKRRGIDLVNDNPENSLNAEVENIKSCQNTMRKTLDAVDRQLERNRESKIKLERDLENKDSAMGIDRSCHQMNNGSCTVDIHEGIEKLDPNISQPDSWADNSHQNILDSQAARQESHRLRDQVDSTITESANSMWRSWNESNDALRTRIAETTEAHTRLQYHLSRTKQEIYDQEKHVWALKRAIRDKEAPLKVAQTRLEARTHRPEKEACRDAPYHGLVAEVKELNNSIRQLNGKLKEAETIHQTLLKNKAQLEGDIKIKCQSLFIDNEECLAYRKNCQGVRLHRNQIIFNVDRGY